MRLPPVPIPHAVAQGALRLRRRAADLADSPLPVEVALFELLTGYQRTRIAGALVTTGLADALGEGARDPRDLAGELGLDPPAVERFLRAACAARLVRFDRRGHARLTRLGGPLRGDHPRSVASWAAVVASRDVWRAYGELDDQLREGVEPSGHRRAFGNSVWERYGERPEDGELFGRAMRELTEFDKPMLVAAYPWPEEGVVCDVAGGVGTLLAAILERRPRLRGILVDDPAVLADAEGYLRERGVGDRVERRPGDLLGDLEAEADVYVLKWILHDWSDETCIEILRRVRAGMPSGARVVAIDQHNHPDHPAGLTPLVDLHMMVVCEGGRERTPDEVHDLMRAAGLEPGAVRHAGIQMLVEGVAP